MLKEIIVYAVVARYTAWKINCKYKRYEARLKRNAYFKSLSDQKV